uniref:Uncharacterized protein n=1 Tax=Anguilla anguilla TaxID=7936 RepID=A0A0E9SA40_ANGAN
MAQKLEQVLKVLALSPHVVLGRYSFAVRSPEFSTKTVNQDVMKLQKLPNSLTRFIL